MQNWNGLLDTGNLLKEPITGTPVVVVEKKSLEEIIPIEILNNVDKIVGGGYEKIIENIKLEKFVSRFRMIPFSSIGKQNGLLLGIKVDNVNIILEDRTEVIKNAIVGIYDKSFTKNGLYSAIFGLDLLEGGNLDECISNVKI